MILLLLLAAVSPPVETAPEIAAVEVRGATVYSTERVLSLLRLHTGSRLRRDPKALAQILEDTYHDDGYPSARVEARFEEGILTLSVREGTLDAVVIEGLSPEAEERARRILALRTGTLVSETEISDALRRVYTTTGGAIAGDGEPPFRFETTEDTTRLVLTLRSRRLKVSPRFLGPENVALYNRVDGFAPWAGADFQILDADSLNHATIYVRGGYGFASKAGRYALGMRRPFAAGGPITAGYEYHDFTDTDDLFRDVAIAESLATFFVRESIWDYYRRRGHEAYVLSRLGHRAELGATFRSDTYESLPLTDVYSVFSGDLERNPAIRPGLMRSLLLTGRWRYQTEAPFRYYPPPIRNAFGEWGIPDTGLAADLSVEIASRAAFGGGFSFTRTILNVRTARPVAEGAIAGVRAVLGLGSGDVPPQKLFYLGGASALSAFDFKEFQGRNMALVTLECRRPLRAFWPAPVVFYEGGALWGPGLAPTGWRSEVGAGLEWGTRGQDVVRLDFGFALSSKARQGLGPAP